MTPNRSFAPEALLPAAFPRLREATAEDFLLLVKWLEAGRAEGVFRPGPAASVRSIRAYHESLQRRGWNHSVLVVETGAVPGGYVDFRWRGALGEVLGIYLERPLRRQRLGAHLLALAAERLRGKGCQSAVAEIYSENTPSRRAAARAGYSRHQRGDRLEDGRQVELWRRKLVRRPRLQALNPRYGDLAGENLVDQHFAAATLLLPNLVSVAGCRPCSGSGPRRMALS